MMDSLLLPLSGTCKAQDSFLASPTGSYTYGDLQQFEHHLVDLIDLNQIDHRKPLGLHARSSDELIFIMAVCWKLGIPFVSFNPDAQTSTFKKQLKEVTPGLVITGFPDKEYPDGQKTVEIKKFNLSKILAGPKHEQKKLALKNEGQKENNIFGYFFTSGTSGKPKIVPLKRRQVHTGARASAQNIKPGKNECWFLCLPLHHIGGISVILRSLIYGSAIYRMDDFSKADAAKILSKEEKVVAASLVPTMLSRLLDDPSFSTHSSFKALLLGGGPISSSLLKECNRRSIPIIASYGMTETCAQIAANPIFSQSENKVALYSAGKIFAPNKIEIRSSDNKASTTNESGTIWLKGPQIFDGYLNVNKSDLFDEDGWFNTGDYGRLDEEGNLYIEARRTDLIITGGENVSPLEIEVALNNLESVKEAAVFGIPDEEWGQKVVAAIVFKQGENTSLTAMQEFLRNEIEGFKIPKEVVAVKSLPRTESGKIKRSELAKLFLG